jgi:hypothetical protein
MAAAPAKIAREYHLAAQALAKAEKAHEAALDKLQAALDEYRAHDVGRLRLAARDSEAALATALKAADDLHRNYWRARREQMLVELPALLMWKRRLNRVYAAEGVLTHDPAGALIASTPAEGPAPDVVDDVDAVAIDAPFSELLRDLRGCWIRR